MKAVFSITIGFTIYLVSSCQNDSSRNPVSLKDSSSIRSFEIYKGDTCNRADWKGRKQGKWYLFNKKNLKVIDTVFYKDGIEINKN
ncbi:MAG: hypothetical protein SFY56_01385 [Bacteroidota bacterium]|nr:hypothetical protein [Bacteroidota bacterium]